MDVLDIMKHFNNIEKELSYIKGVLLNDSSYSNKKNVSKPLNNSKKVVLLLDNGKEQPLEIIWIKKDFITHIKVKLLLIQITKFYYHRGNVDVRVAIIF